MKIPSFIMALAFASCLFLPAPSLSFENETNGFMGLTWGDNISSFKGMVEVRKTVKGGAICKRDDGALKVGDIELTDIQFQFPAYVGPRKLGIQGRNQATLTVKNYGTVRIRVQVAIALFDADGNLLGCGTTGTKVAGTKAGGEESYYVSFDYVNSRLTSAKTFYITVETEPDVPQVSDGKPAPKSAG